MKKSHVQNEKSLPFYTYSHQCPISLYKWKQIQTLERLSNCKGTWDLRFILTAGGRNWFENWKHDII